MAIIQYRSRLGSLLQGGLVQEIEPCHIGYVCHTCMFGACTHCTCQMARSRMLQSNTMAATRDFDGCTRYVLTCWWLAWFAANYKQQPMPKSFKDPALYPTVSSNLSAIIKAADFIGRAIQNRSAGYLPNHRQYRMCGLAVLECAQTLKSVWAAGLAVDGKVSSGKREPHQFGWRDMFDICVRWRQLSEVCTNG
jgi:hypothetical protein